MRQAGLNEKPRRTYGLGGFVIESHIPFPELEPVSEGEGKAICAVRLTDALSRNAASEAPLLQRRLANGNGWLSTTKSDRGYTLRFQDFATFVVSNRGDQVDCHADAAVPAATVRHLFLDAVFPLVLNLQGHDALHATAVDGPDGCCAFLGDAGFGKSTLAAAFVRRAWTLVCDDCLQFQPREDGIGVVPGYGGLRLWPDSIEAAFNDGSFLRSVQDGRKKRVQVAGMDPMHPVRLNRVYLLNRSEETDDTRIRIQAAPAREAFIELVRHAFRLDVGDRKMLARQFRSLQRLVEHVPICRLTYPRDFAHLQAVAGAIADDLRSGTVMAPFASYPAEQQG
jgi:hypothetical protein